MNDQTELFKPESKTIKEIFGDTNSFYTMPEYQRPYSWDDERVSILWDDIKTSYENFYESTSNNDNPVIDENYFLGSIILTPSKYGYDVVDGQQRLTTLTILFCVIRDLFPELNKDANISTDPEAITIDEIKDFISYKDKRERLRLLTHITHQNDLQNEIIRKEGILWPDKFTKTDKQNKKYMNTARLFRDYLNDLNEKSPEVIVPMINYLFNRVRLIKITCSSQAFAIKLFQVLNTRGMDLVPADLIKSFLYGNISKFEKNSDQIELKRKEFMQEWNTIEQLLKTTSDSITDIFNMYLYYISNTNPKRTLYEELYPFIEDKEPTIFIFEFKKFVNDYIDIQSSKDYVTYSLKYLQHQLYWKPILTSARYLSFKRVDDLKNELRRFYYLYWIAGYTSPKIKQISFNILKWIKGKVEFSETEKYEEFNKFLDFSKTKKEDFASSYKSTKNQCFVDFSIQSNPDLYTAIKFKIEEKLKMDGVYDRVKKNLEDNCYNENWLKPLLLIVEYKQWNVKDFIPLDRFLHAEHIMPQSRKYKYWQSLFTDKEAEDYLMKIENLTLLSGDRNIEASNRPFNLEIDVSPNDEKKLFYNETMQKYLDKKFIYKGKGFDGAVEFLITQQIYINYTEWNKQEMEERKKWLLKEIDEVLKYNQ